MELENVEHLDFLEMCESDPKRTNDIIQNIRLRDSWSNIVINSVPWSIYVSHTLSSIYLNKLVCLKGSIIKTYPVYFTRVMGEQACLKCNDKILLEEREMSKKRSGHICASCGSAYVRIDQVFNEAIPTQSIRIQDIGNFGVVSETIEILLEGKYSGKFSPGDKVVVTGYVSRKWKQIKKNEPLLSTICLKALQVEYQDERGTNIDGITLDIQDFVVKSTFMKRMFLLETFAPEIQGLLNVKLALLITAACGVYEHGNIDSTRSSCHILMVGDPGTGKTHLLKEISKLVVPGMLVNGVGTSDAGLTSCAIKQGKEWVLEAGALVLSDMGICCIDEFNRLKISEKGGLLESMEQQTLSIAKAGIVTTLNTRCSVVAASSSKYIYNIHKTVSENLGISTPLVGRFDLIFGLFDKANDQDDRLTCEKVLNRTPFLPKDSPYRWTYSTLRGYISHCRKRHNKITPSLCDILLKYYLKKRNLDGKNEFNTIRMLESLVRIAEAHSKLMNSDLVSEEDAYIAIILMESGINTSNVIGIDLTKIFYEEMYFNETIKKLNQKYNLKPNSNSRQENISQNPCE